MGASRLASGQQPLPGMVPFLLPPPLPLLPPCSKGPWGRVRMTKGKQPTCPSGSPRTAPGCGLQPQAPLRRTPSAPPGRLNARNRAPQFAHHSLVLPLRPGRGTEGAKPHCHVPPEEPFINLASQAGQRRPWNTVLGSRQVAAQPRTQGGSPFEF